jgi:glycerophosphoryl diester phosphodiesterase
MRRTDRKWFLLTLGAGIVLLTACYGSAQKRRDMPTAATDGRERDAATATATEVAVPRRPLVMAHRGGAGVWPENTLHAFAQAVALGVDVLEMDLHATSDGALVIIHDATIDRTTNGAGAVGALTLAELKKLDAGYRWTNDGGRTYPFRGKGLTVPTLGEVLEAFPRARLNIDIKGTPPPALVKNFCRALRESSATNRVTVASFSSQVLGEFRRECPEVATSASMEEVLALASDLQAGRDIAGDKTRPRILQVPDNAIGRGWMEAAHRAGLEVHVWTVNDEAAMRRMLALGVDGIMTDYPDKLIALLKQAAARPAVQ